MTSTRIPFEIETSRIIQLLAKQIYQSPLALLRENVQNAFDAVRERAGLDPNFEPRIDVEISTDRVVIIDNGIGMSREELRKHFWTAGSSSKNTADARAAGVVGTFGIGAMANFGVARSLHVETESRRSRERTRSTAELEKLSLREDCVDVVDLPTKNAPGTTITAILQINGSISLGDATEYVRSFTRLIDIPVYVNGTLVSQQNIDQIVPGISPANRQELQNEAIGRSLQACGEFIVDNNGIVRLSLRNLFWNGRPLGGRLVLLSSQRTLHTARSGFGLAIAPVNSIYGFGGIADLLVLEPTAGREAITSDGITLLQAMFNDIDDFVSLRLSGLDECDVSTPFMQWVQRNGRYDLAGRLTIDTSGPSADRRRNMKLEETVRRGDEDGAVLLYEGNDPAVIRTYATNERAMLLLLSRSQPRRTCQQNYLLQHPEIARIPDVPTVLDRRSGYDLTVPEWGVAFRVASVVESDYFVEAEVDFGKVSHGVALIVDPKHRSGKLGLILNADAENVRALLQVYEIHPEAFPSLAKDFVRTVVFPQIANLVPSSTRAGAQAFLEAIKRKRETFEYDLDESDDLSAVLKDYESGELSLEGFKEIIERTNRVVMPNVQVVDTTSSMQEVVPDIVENERTLSRGQQQDAQPEDQSGVVQWPVEPPILRIDSSSEAKLITIDPGDPNLRNYRCFIALTPKAQGDFGSFFTQPHSTSVVWGGQKTLFIFMHHSGEFGLYYDLQTAELLDAPSGGGSRRTSTIVLKNRIYVPVPEEISGNFVPSVGQRKRFEIRADIIRASSSSFVK